MKRLYLRTKRPAFIVLMIAFSLIIAACSSAPAERTPASAPTDTVSVVEQTPTSSAPGTGGAAEQTPTSALPDTGRSAEQTPTSALPGTGGATVQVVDHPEFGRILATADGRTLYTNTVDTPDDLKCTNVACTGFWPPYTVDGEPTASADIAGALGTVTRPDGSVQVTYNRQPLYTFYLDKQPGDANGNGFTDFGGTWHVVSLEGSAKETPSDGSIDPGGIDY